jgi:hypothetical protein
MCDARSGVFNSFLDLLKALEDSAGTELVQSKEVVAVNNHTEPTK